VLTAGSQAGGRVVSTAGGEVGAVRARESVAGHREIQRGTTANPMRRWWITSTSWTRPACRCSGGRGRARRACWELAPPARPARCPTCHSGPHRGARAQSPAPRRCWWPSRSRAPTTTRTARELGRAPVGPIPAAVELRCQLAPDRLRPRRPDFPERPGSSMHSPCTATGRRVASGCAPTWRPARNRSPSRWCPRTPHPATARALAGGLIA